MEFTFENQGTNTYLVYSIKEKDVIDSMSLGMLTNNKILGLAPAFFTQIDNTKYIKYNVSAKISVKQFFEGQVNKRRLLGVFHGIVNAMISAEEYMIDVNSILLDLEYIYVDVSTCETVLICLPVVCTDSKPEELGSFFKNIVFRTKFDQTENCDYVASLINYLNSTPVFSVYDFKTILDDLSENYSEQKIMAEKQEKKAEKQVLIQKADLEKQNNPPGNISLTYQTAEQEKQVNISPDVPVEKNMKVQPQSNGKPVLNNNMAVPVKKADKKMEQSMAVGEKQIGLLELLMHYSKENAQIYKAQKQKRKQMSSSSENVKVTVEKKKDNMDFVIPGQQPQITEKESDIPIPNSQLANIPNQIPQEQPVNFGETTVLGGGMVGETTVLSVSSAAIDVKPCLIRVKNKETILINKPVFRIGKEKSYVDYFIGDNAAISRSHANIVSRNGEYYVVDTNSTNHTYLNGKMISSNTENRLESGSLVRLADEEFEFKLY